MLRWLLFLVMIFSITSCGFKPRGELPLAPTLHHLYIQTSDPYGQLAHNLEEYLKESGVQLASSANEADVVLQILSEKTNQILLSVGGTQQTRQYKLLLTVMFQLTTPQGRILLEPQMVSESSTIPIQSNRVLAGSNEANNLFRQMRIAIVNDIMNRLSSQMVTDRLSKTP